MTAISNNSGRSPIGVVVGFELRRALTGPYGLLALALFGVFHTWAIRSASSWAGETTDVGAVATGVLGWATGVEAGTLSAVFHNHPPMLVVFFLLALVGTPLLTILASCDQLASDLGSHHLRFLLVRVTRGQLYLGKALGALAFIALLQTAATLAAIIAAANAGVDSSDAVLFGGRVLLCLIAFSVPFVALAALAGTLMPHPAIVIAAGFGFQFVVWMASSLGGVRIVQFAYPTALRFQLVSDRVADVLPALGHMTALTAVFLVGGLLVFRWRDL